ncbi:MAG TPA: molybdenum cofactor guanylyltransferase MobA [Gammaproteobacteria bacterium]
MPPEHRPISCITAVILAGGQGSRMGGIDKGLVNFRGKPLIAHVIERIAPQTDQILINANRSQERYAEFGYPLIADTLPDYPGPLAGILAALEVLESERLLAVPCDTPLLPVDLVQRLSNALDVSGAAIAIPVAGERLHASIMLMRRGVARDLRDYLLAGERKVQLWLRRQHTVHVDFSDNPGAFANLNTLDEIRELEHHGGH